MGCLGSKDDEEGNVKEVQLKVNIENKVVLSEEEWHNRLTSEEFRILRKKGTEASGTGKYLHVKGHGVFKCAGCGADLFDSSSKFDSGSGWPSFYSALKDKDNPDLAAVQLTSDRSHGMTRTEATCAKCGGHIGHMFEDGPAPSGLRYCTNSPALHFQRTS